MQQQTHENIQCFPEQETNMPMANAVTCPTTGRQLEYKQLIENQETKHIWTQSFSNELGRLAQGNDANVKGTNTIFFIPRNKVPSHKMPTYGRIVVDIRPQKTEPERTRLTVGGNLIDYPGSVSTDTADLTMAKLIFNSTISTPNAKFMGIDVKNFYLGTPMETYEYMRLPLNIIPQDIINWYKLTKLVHSDGYVYIEIQRGMYGLPQAGILANKQLQFFLAEDGYHPTKNTPGLWKHETKPIAFSLVVDDFGVKYVGKQNAQHLIDTLQKHYTTSVDWEGKLYCGMTLQWDYKNGTVDVSMPGYVKSALHTFQHDTPQRPTNAPSAYTPPIFGATIQYTTPPDTSPPIDKAQTKRIQTVVGKFLYYARAVDPTMLHALNDLATQQSKGTQKTMQALTHLLNYAATHPDATIRYTKSAMILHIHSDASYLSAPNARSRVGGHHFLTNTTNIGTTDNNGAILNIASILRNVMSSAAEAEVGALFVNAKEAVVIRTTLAELGHPQLPTPIQTDNSTAHGIINGTVKQK